VLGLSVKRGRLARLQAQDLARVDGHAHIETADLLLAILGEPEGAGGRALRNLGVEEEPVRAGLARAERKETPLEGAGPTAELKGVIEAAFHAVAYPDEVGTRHLVIALAAGGGTAGGVLTELGVQEPALRAELDRGETETL
jgi:ATP-dependent Clp protease ATP-binding subunit ClpB